MTDIRIDGLSLECWREGVMHEHIPINVRDGFLAALDLIESQQARIAALELMLEGKEGLLVAFRLGKRPAEKTWKLLETAEKALAALTASDQSEKGEG